MKKSDIQQFERQLKAMEQDYNQRLGAARILKERKKLLNIEIAALERQIEEEKIIGIFLKKVSTYSRNIVKQFIEDIVTDALRYVFYPEMRFEIELNDDPDKEKSKPFAEFYIVENINGQECKQLPKDACGGGALDIVSTSLRVVFAELSHKPSLKAPLLLDEPGKNLSREDDISDPTLENYSLRFAEYLKNSSKTFKRQMIMVTHNPNLVNIADNTIRITKKNGESIPEYL